MRPGHNSLNPALCLSYDITKIHMCLIYFKYCGSFTPNYYICRGIKISLQFPGIEDCPFMQRYNCWTVYIFALRTVTAAVSPVMFMHDQIS